MCSAREGNGNSFQYSCLENLTDRMKRQKDTTPEDEPSPRSEGVQYAAGEGQKAMSNSFRRRKQLGQSGNDAQLWMSLVVRVKSDAVKNNSA